MKNTNRIKQKPHEFSKLHCTELMTINGGDDPPNDLATLAGYTWVFTTLHFVTGGFSSYYLLYKKLSN